MTSRSQHAAAGNGAHRCCGCAVDPGSFNRRDFLGGAVLGGTALTNLSWARWTAAGGADIPAAPARKPLVVQPVLLYTVPERRPQTSWRGWGGIETEEQARQEQQRISSELEGLRAKADFPVVFQPLIARGDTGGLAAIPEVAKADALVIYAAGGSVDGVENLGKPVVFFLRHRSGPVSLWYEIVSPRYLRQHTDDQKIATVLPEDVVIDRVEELAWRLRGLCGLVNTAGTRIVAVGGADAWAQPRGVVPELVKKVWKLDIQEVSYDDLGKLIQDARADSPTLALARERAAAYLTLPGTTLETDKVYVENAFVLDQVFRRTLAEAGCRAITINQCMGTIMPMSETSACLALSTLNDDGYLAFCESDFVVIPSGILLGGITGVPVFLNDPTYPHDGVITLAHCTAPRKLDGATIEPARLLTHFESDYGAAPKVEMKVGQVVTNVIPDFASKRWVGFKGTIAENPFLPICRSQIEVTFDCDSGQLADRMPGFHWMTVYGDCRRETGYALRRVGINWECLDDAKAAV